MHLLHMAISDSTSQVRVTPPDLLSRESQHFHSLCMVLPVGPYKKRMAAVATAGPVSPLAAVSHRVGRKRKRQWHASRIMPPEADAALIGRFVVESFLKRVKKGLQELGKLSTQELNTRGYRKDSYGLLWTNKERLYIPKVEDLRHDCIAAVHSHPTSGHYALRRTLKKVREVFYGKDRNRMLQSSFVTVTPVNESRLLDRSHKGSCSL